MSGTSRSALATGVVIAFAIVAGGHLGCDDPAPMADVEVADATADSTPETDVPPGPQELVLGVNETGRNTPEFFDTLPPGAPLTIEFGPQGLWMVVLAFKTRGLWDTKTELSIEASCWIGDELRGELLLAKQRLFVGGDGFDYYYNLFLVVDEVGAAGNDAQVRVSVDDGNGVRREETQSVFLVGGP